MLVHTVRLNQGATATRKSKTRCYQACIVATATEQTVRFASAAKAALESKLQADRTSLASETARQELTPEEAEKNYRAAVGRWFGEEYYAIQRAAMAEDRRLYGDALARVVTERMIARGYTDPWDLRGPHVIIELHGRITGAERRLADWTEPTPGRQVVVSWHGTPQNAAKARGGRGCGWWTERGYTLEIRTDFEVRETAKRVAKVKTVD